MGSFEKIEMKDMDQCEAQGADYLASNRLGDDKPHHAWQKQFECFKGK